MHCGGSSINVHGDDDPARDLIEKRADYAERRTTLHSITSRRVGCAASPDGHTISRSVRIRPSPYSRSTRPPEFTTRCKNACSSNCGPASRY